MFVHARASVRRSNRIRVFVSIGIRALSAKKYIPTHSFTRVVFFFRSMHFVEYNSFIRDRGEKTRKSARTQISRANWQISGRDTRVCAHNIEEKHGFSLPNRTATN